MLVFFFFKLCMSLVWRDHESNSQPSPQEACTLLIRLPCPVHASFNGDKCASDICTCVYLQLVNTWTRFCMDSKGNGADAGVRPCHGMGGNQVLQTSILILLKHLFLHRRDHWNYLIEPVTAEAYGVRVWECLRKQIWHVCTSSISKSLQFKIEVHQAKIK